MSLLLSLWIIPGAGAQELPLKRALPGVDAFSCPEIAPWAPAAPEEQAQARVLGSNADQALLLGDQTRARDLLARATELDPASAELAYRYARILEDLGESAQAISTFCRTLALGAEDLGIEDARSRLDALVQATQPRLPETALADFSQGLLDADEGRLGEAVAAFTAAQLQAPGWGDPLYNRAVIFDRLGDVDSAVQDFQRFLTAFPEGVDAIAVSQRMGQLQSAGPLPSPGSTLALGMVLPGMGQFSSGRAKEGFAVLGLVGGILAAGFLIEEVETLCVGTVTGGGECPAERVISEQTNNPYKTHSLIAAGAITVLGAFEAFLKVRGNQSSDEGTLLALDVGEARLLGPSVSARGSRLTLSLVQVTF